jgi:hypothetical protein
VDWTGLKVPDDMAMEFIPATYATVRQKLDLGEPPSSESTTLIETHKSPRHIPFKR